MRIVKMYEATIMAETSDHAAQILVLSATSALGLNSNTLTADLLAQLGLTTVAEVSASNLSRALAVLLSAGVPTDELNKQLISASRGQIESHEGTSAIATSDIRFAEVVAFQEVVPIENSPLKAEALATLVTKATGAGVGAFAGFVAFGASPLLLVFVPAGMIICGAAKGVADALENGLRERLIDLLKGRQKRRTRSAGATSRIKSPGTIEGEGRESAS